MGINQDMNIIRKTGTMTIGALAAIGLFLVFISWIIIANVTHAYSKTTGERGRLVTIYDRGVEKAIVTDAVTVGDALKEAGISVDSKDLVEPSISNKLIADNYKVNVYRARPVIVVDGSTRIKVSTPYQTAEQIAADAGITLFDEDRTALERTDDIIAEGAGLRLTITRAMPVNFTLFGNTATVRTQAKTVGEMLVEKGVELGASDKVTPSLSIDITENMTIKVWREGIQTVFVEEEIDFDAEKIENADMTAGTIEIQSPGEKGLRNVTYEILIQDGREVSRKEIASLTLKEPKKQVEIVGVKGKYTTPSENENITWDYLISNGFSRMQAAGIMGNLMQEHGFNTSDTSGGLGLVQWTGSRKDRLVSMYPNSYTNIYSQLEYLMFELNGNYSGVRDAIKASGSLVESVQIFQNRFEKCGYCREDKRIEYAQNILASH